MELINFNCTVLDLNANLVKLEFLDGGKSANCGQNYFSFDTLSILKVHPHISVVEFFNTLER